MSLDHLGRAVRSKKAGAEMPKSLANQKKLWTDRQTDRPTDRLTDMASSRVACPRLKIINSYTDGRTSRMKSQARD